MARPKGPLGNTPRDQADDFVGVDKETFDEGPAPRWPPKPKRITKNTFHAKVEGETSRKRADRVSHFRKGGFVAGVSAGQGRPGKKPGNLLKSYDGAIKSTFTESREPPHDLHELHYKRGGEVAKGRTNVPSGSTDKEGVVGGSRHAGKFKSGGRLTMKERKALPSTSFALPGKGKGPSGKGAGSYPIPDASHARNALARVSQHGSSAEKARVRAKVHAKLPGIGQK